MATERVVVDASAMVDLLVQSPRAAAVAGAVSGRELSAPAHFDAEVLSALGRLHRSGELSEAEVTACLKALANAPLLRHVLPTLVAGSWSRRHNLQLADALYVELAHQLDARLITADAGMAAAYSESNLIEAV